jgi:hypothetical protein
MPAGFVFGGWRGVNSLGAVESIRGATLATSSCTCRRPVILPAMKKWIAATLLFVTVTITATAAVAQQTHNQYEPPNAAGAGQKLLAQFAGDWDLVKTFFPMNGKPIVTKGTCKQYMIEDGKFLQSDFTFFDSEGNKSTGTGISGFDSKTNRFTTVWYDSRQTTMSIRQSDGTFDGKNIVLWATALDPDRPGRKTVARAHLEEDGRVLLHRHFLIDDKGEQRMMLELRLTRK